MKNSPVAVVTKSENSKLSKDNKVNATYASQATCPDDCPFRDSGCYAEMGAIGYTTSRLNKADEQDPIEIAKLEAAEINNLNGSFPLRLHVVGDCKNTKSAEIIAEACDAYIEKNNQPVWNYTHNRRIPRATWGKMSILRSCTTDRQSEVAHKAGFASALIVEKFKHDKRYRLKRGGLYGIPCPVQTGKSESCITCKLCMQNKMLHKFKNVILFKAHGTMKKHIINVISKHKIKEQ